MNTEKLIKASKYLYQQDHKELNDLYESAISEGKSNSVIADARIIVESRTNEILKSYLPEKEVAKAIKAAMKVCYNPIFVNWAKNWLLTKNQWGGDIMNGERAAVHAMTVNNTLFRDKTLTDAEKSAFYACCSATSYAEPEDITRAIKFAEKALKNLA